MYENYAQIVYNIIGLDWNQEPGQPEKKISLKKLRNCICQAQGFEKDMLTLLYGTTGLTTLDSKTQF